MTMDVVRIKAIDYLKEKMIRGNKDIKEFRDIKVLDTSSDEDSVCFKVFARVVEDIGMVSEINDESIPK